MVILIVAGCFTMTAWLSGMCNTAVHRALPGVFAHAIVPIAMGYLFGVVAAHDHAVVALLAPVRWLVGCRCSS